ncbi:hypothetical protein [Streptosporangium sp. NPDC051022]|uniref:hypothetical protein n=1 Tax=Streptosporangium sp. NPDC051022 TaxID=3155752 RepID=UPI003433B0A1
MILISAGLVLTAIVLLIAGFVLAKPFLVMWSIAVSVLSAVFLVIGALLRRHELFPRGGRAATVPPLPPTGPVPPGQPMMPSQPLSQVPHTAVPHDVRQTATVTSQPTLGRPAAGPVPASRQGHLDDEAIVLVIPGRKRYHVAGCRQLAGKDHEELTHEEAREEGFTPCSTCLPEFTAGLQPLDAQESAAPSSFPEGGSRGSAEPGTPGSQGSGPSRPSQESGASRSGESALHEQTARFIPPYGPVTSDTPVTRPYVQGPSAPGEQTRPGSPGQPAAPPLRAADPAASFPVRFPAPISEEPGDPNATSWFNREAATAEPAKAGGGAGEGAKAASPAGAGDPAERGNGGAGPDKSAVSGKPAPGSTPASRGPAPSTGKREESAGQAPEPKKTTAPAKTAEPVEPAETGPGRAGRPVPVGSTSAEPKSPRGSAATTGEDDEEAAGTNPRGIPAVREQAAAGPEMVPEMVKVIVGTRRFHSLDCPLVKGVHGGGVDTLPLADAEAADMVSCSVCLRDYRRAAR